MLSRFFLPFAFVLLSVPVFAALSEGIIVKGTVLDFDKESVEIGKDYDHKQIVVPRKLLPDDLHPGQKVQFKVNRKDIRKPFRPQSKPR